MPHPFRNQHLALPADPPPIFVFWARRFNHCAYTGLAALEREQCPDQGFTINLVGLRTPASA
ncbi:hypothetical protein EKH55_4700 [Sinorhizobium alkalisoli]|nr:hypothetical protein EKH55_4700 [Sinorhizobium alkalisoli]